jgi:hypothetical protein
MPELETEIGRLLGPRQADSGWLVDRSAANWQT